MSRIIMKSLGASLLSLGLAWSAAAGGSLAEGPSGTAFDSPSCDISVAYQGNSVVLEGLVFAPISVSGVYEMRISQIGVSSSDIFQSGDFQASPNVPGSLGLVSLSLGRSGYDATLHVHWDGGAADCTRHVSAGTRL